MRLDINLASQPYEDARQFWMRWGTALVGVSFLTLALVAVTVSGWLAARHDHAKISDLKASITQRDRAHRAETQTIRATDDLLRCSQCESVVRPRRQVEQIAG